MELLKESKSNFEQEQSAMKRNGRIDLPKASKLILLGNRISPMHRNGRIELLQSVQCIERQNRASIGNKTHFDLEKDQCNTNE